MKCLDVHEASDEVFHDTEGQAEKCGLGGFTVEQRTFFQSNLGVGGSSRAITHLVLFQHCGSDSDDMVPGQIRQELQCAE